MTYFSPELTLGFDDAFKEAALVEKITYLSQAVNTREISIYDTEEFDTGEIWFNLADFKNPRTTFRKVIIFDSLTAAGTTSVKHGLGDVSRFAFTNIYGTARNTAGTLHVALPQGGLDDVMITIDANNVNIICRTATYNTFAALVVLEYLKN